MVDDCFLGYQSGVYRNDEETEPIRKQIAAYTGNYVVDAAQLTVHVFERDGRLMVRVASEEPEWLWPVAEHSFRGGGGELTFDVQDGVAAAIDFVRNSGRRARAVRR